MVSNSTGLAVVNSFSSFTQVHARISCDYELLLNLRDNYFALENFNSIVYKNLYREFGKTWTQSKILACFLKNIC